MQNLKPRSYFAPPWKILLVYLSPKSKQSSPSRKSITWTGTRYIIFCQSKQGQNPTPKPPVGSASQPSRPLPKPNLFHYYNTVNSNFFQWCKSFYCLKVSQEKSQSAWNKCNSRWLWGKWEIQPHSGSVMNTLLYFLPRCEKYFHTTLVNVKYHFISKCFKFRGNSTRGYQKERLACCSSLLKNHFSLWRKKFVTG